MNKTYLLEAIADYTEGTILVVADSLQEIKDKILEYHRERKTLLSGHKFVDKAVRESETFRTEWNEILNDFKAKEAEIDKRFGRIPRIDTGLVSDGSGWFSNDILIVEKQEDLGNKDGWCVALQFMSDLEPGFHCVGDYQA